MQLRNGLILLSVVALSPACARYGVRHDESRQYSEARLVINSPKSIVEEGLLGFLRNRGMEPAVHRSPTGAFTDFECDWVRDSSLDLFYIVSGSRKSHLVHWKAVWRLEAQGPRSTRVHLKIMELLFMGPQENAGDIPSLNGQWVEAPSTHLREWLELRRFYTEKYPRESLPREMTILKIPTLDFAPLSLKDSRPSQLYKSPRPFSF
jgi:hypothetical protein